MRVTVLPAVVVALNDWILSASMLGSKSLASTSSSMAAVVTPCARSLRATGGCGMLADFAVSTARCRLMRPQP